MWIEQANNAVESYKHEGGGETIVLLHNLTDQPQNVHSSELDGNWLDLLQGIAFMPGSALSLAPFQYLWLARS
jgi:hypothetical protein